MSNPKDKLLQCECDIVGDLAKIKSTADLRELAASIASLADTLDSQMGRHPDHRFVCRATIDNASGALLGIAFYAAVDEQQDSSQKISLQERIAKAAARKDRLAFRKRKETQLLRGHDDQDDSED